MYNTTLDTDLTKKLRILAVPFEKRQNDLFEEVIRDLLKKYEKKVRNRDVKAISGMSSV